MGATSANFMPKQASGKTPAYYKGIQAAKKGILQANKEIKCNHFADAFGNIKQAALAIEPFSAVRSELPNQGGQKMGGNREQIIGGTSKALENAAGELDYTMVDNGYKNLVEACFILAPYA